MVYDSTSGQVILFGGLAQAGYGNHPDTFCRDTGAYDLKANRWTNLNPGGNLPPAASDYSMVYDSTSGQVILFGGWARGVEFNDTWAFSIKP
jgi:hypothetical protein